MDEQEQRAGEEREVCEIEHGRGGQEFRADRQEVDHVAVAQPVDEVAEGAGEHERDGRVPDAAPLNLGREHRQDQKEHGQRQADDEGQTQGLRQGVEGSERAPFVLRQAKAEGTKADGRRTEEERGRDVLRQLVEEKRRARDDDGRPALRECVEHAQLTNSFIWRIGISTAKTMIEMTMPMPTIISGSSRLVSIEMRLSTWDS